MQTDFAKFQPHPLIRGGHLQTILSRVIGTPPVLRDYEEVDIRFEDGDETSFKIDHPVDRQHDTPILALFHGLGGCSESPYKLRIAERGVQAGLSVARFSHRGCGVESRFKAKQIYHSGSRDDVYIALKRLSARFPEAPIAAVGFSLSGAMMLNLVGHRPDIQSDIPNLRMAAAVCPPLDLHSSSKKISRFSNIVYDQYYSFFLQKHLKRRSERLGLPAPSFSKRLVTLALFDNEITAPLAGFRDAMHYYNECSPLRVLDKIKIPTLILAAADDPVVDPKYFDQAKNNKNLHINMQPTGGHMGFFARNKTAFGDRRWLEYYLITWAIKNLRGDADTPKNLP